MPEMKGYKLTVDEKKCTACQACQMVCAYHLTGSFSLENSCISIKLDNADGTIQMSLDEERCDMCENEDMPLCLKYCPPKAIRIARR